ncbi:LysR family transcriptional regulator [Pseudomonas alliivorans]|nr:LysR family transcriptional regulator [Pseudomonas alliivorans]MEE5174763.1 LysR family transcriptional regulator [Pseudomonas alliivorans]
MQISDVEAFAVIVDSGSLSGAARRLGVSPMAISRRLAALEQALSVRLVHRTTRSISLTPEGETFLPFAHTLLDASAAAKTTLRTGAGSVSGVLKVTAPTVFGQSVIMPLIPTLLSDHPALRIDLNLSDSIVDIVGLGIDVAIRIATLRDSTLVARPLAANPRVLCASPGYLAEHGLPGVLHDLHHHRCIGLHGMPHWSFVRGREPVAFKGEGMFSANSVEAVRTACQQGLGLALLTYWDVREDVAQGRLCVVELEDVLPEQLVITAVLPSRHQIPHRVQVFLDCLKATLIQPA